MDIAVGATVRHTVSITSLNKPDPLTFEVYKKGSQRLGKINGQQSMEIQPRSKPLVSLWKLNFGKYLF